jgi:excisionase family DNA binding protein
MGSTASTEVAVFLTEKEAARLISVSNRTLQAWRCRNAGPPFVRMGRAIRYHRCELILWMTANTCVPAAIPR